jgi:hypothetical protein
MSNRSDNQMIRNCPSVNVHRFGSRPLFAAFCDALLQTVVGTKIESNGEMTKQQGRILLLFVRRY